MTVELLTAPWPKPRLNHDHRPEDENGKLLHFEKEATPPVRELSDVEVTVAKNKGPHPIDWATFWDEEEDTCDEFLIEPFVPKNRSTAIYSKAGEGKSLLVLEACAAAAMGRSVFGQPAKDPIKVVYMDLEMSEDLIRERLKNFGYGPDDDLSNLFYFSLPALPGFDTEEGGIEILDIAIRHDADLVVIDTMARAVKGPEDKSDTYRDYFRHTGMFLLANGVTVIRLDHAGKDVSRGQRGSSGKNDDVDVVFELTCTDGINVNLKRTKSRMTSIPEVIKLKREDLPLTRHVLVDDGGFPEGTLEVVAYLDAFNVPIDATIRDAQQTLRDNGQPRRTNVVTAAVKYRKTAGNSRETAPEDGVGNKSGNAGKQP
jgi:AAA domain